MAKEDEGKEMNLLILENKGQISRVKGQQQQVFLISN